MIVRTRKYQLPQKAYILMALKGVLRQQWWVLALVVAFATAGTLLVPSTLWFIIGSLIVYTLYILFWVIQFSGVTQLEQGKILFERLSYEITSQQILIKLDSKRGMPIKWEQIRRAKIGKDYFLLAMSKAQLIHWPFKIFNSDNERKFIETVLKRKELIK